MPNPPASQRKRASLLLKRRCAGSEHRSPGGHAHALREIDLAILAAWAAQKKAARTSIGLSIRADSFDQTRNTETAPRRPDQETTMQYLLLIYDEEKTWDAMSEADRKAIAAEYDAFTDDIRKSGHFRNGEALQPTTTATTVRVKNGKTMTTDGPFAETREQLGGMYLIEAANLDDAIEVAARIPSTRVGGSIEIRPVMVFG